MNIYVDSGFVIGALYSIGNVTGNTLPMMQLLSMVGCLAISIEPGMNGDSSRAAGSIM